MEHAEPRPRAITQYGWYRAEIDPSLSYLQTLTGKRPNRHYDCWYCDFDGFVVMCLKKDGGWEATANSLHDDVLTDRQSEILETLRTHGPTRHIACTRLLRMFNDLSEI